MSEHEPSATTIRALRFHAYGEPADVLRLERTVAPAPAPARVRVVVHACGLNPADWALCRGLFASELPRGVGLEVSGVVDALGEGVTDVAVGDRVVGATDYAGAVVAGASEGAILKHWAKVPAGLDMTQAAALPMAMETAYRSIESLRLGAGQSIVIHGAGSTIGFAAVQIALLRGAKVIATAGETYAERLRGFGAKVTAYGDGMADRVLELAGGPVDLALDTAPSTAAGANPLAAVGSGALPDLVRVAHGDPKRVLTISDMAGAAKLGVRTSFTETVPLQYGVLGEFVKHAAEGRFTVPIARTFALEDWRAALELSRSGKARGKLVLMPASAP